MDYPVAIHSQLKQYLRSMRKARGLTQADLAKRLGVGQSRVADIEANPGAVSVEQLLQVLALLNAQLVVRDTQGPTDRLASPAGGQDKTRASTTDAAPAPATANGDKAEPPQGQW